MEKRWQPKGILIHSNNGLERKYKYLDEALILELPNILSQEASAHLPGKYSAGFWSSFFPITPFSGSEGLHLGHITGIFTGGVYEELPEAAEQLLKGRKIYKLFLQINGFAFEHSKLTVLIHKCHPSSLKRTWRLYISPILDARQFWSHLVYTRAGTFPWGHPLPSLWSPSPSPHVLPFSLKLSVSELPPQSHGSHQPPQLPWCRGQGNLMIKAPFAGCFGPSDPSRSLAFSFFLPLMLSPQKIFKSSMTKWGRK